MSPLSELTAKHFKGPEYHFRHLTCDLPVDGARVWVKSKGQTFGLTGSSRATPRSNFTGTTTAAFSTWKWTTGPTQQSTLTSETTSCRLTLGRRRCRSCSGYLRRIFSVVGTYVRGLTETAVGGGELSMRSQIVRGSFRVVFIEYTPTGVTVHYEAALEGGGAVYGKQEIESPAFVAEPTESTAGNSR